MSTYIANGSFDNSAGEILTNLTIYLITQKPAQHKQVIWINSHIKGHFFLETVLYNKAHIYLFH